MIDLEMDQQNHGYLLPKPGILCGTVVSFPQPDIHRMVPTSWNIANPDSFCLTDCYISPLFYQMPQYGGGNHHPAADFEQCVAMASNFYIPSPSIPLHHGSPDQFPSASNYGVMGVHVDEYGRNNHFVDNIRSLYKRETTEGIFGNFQHINASASSGSFVAPLNTRHPEGVTAMDSASLVHLQLGGNDIQTIGEVGSHRSVRNRLRATGLDPVLAYNHDHYVLGNHVGRPFQPSTSLWLDQRFSNNCRNVGVSRWNLAPFTTYMQGNNVNGGSSETGSVGSLHNHETVIDRFSGSTAFLQCFPSGLCQNNFHHPSPSPVQLLRQNVILHPQVAAAGVPLNHLSYSSTNLSQDGMENSLRHPGPGIRSYWPHQEGRVPETSSSYRNLPYMRFLPTEGVAMVEISDIYEGSIYIDHHRDMHLDIEDMSYEELLALGEQIGNVSTGLSEEVIIHQLKTRTYSLSTPVNLEEAFCVYQEPDSCIICQEDYRRQEKIGTLDCGHEYHADCLKKWLLVKNVCPVCKSEALITETHNV